MYRALIVDDEPDIRLGLQLKVDWNSLNATVAAEAANGAEALEKLQLEEIDIMIADMNMPVMNGVSLLEACSRQFPALKVIVVTGYEDFHYAKAALKNQARDYLLKPVSREELLTALTRVIGELDDERKDEDEQKLVQWRLSQYFKEMKEHFILYIVKEELKRKDDVIERSRRFGLDDWDERRVRFLTAGLRERSVHNDAQLRTPDKFHMPFEMVCREFAQTYPASEQPQVFRDANYPGLMHFILPDDEHGIAVFAAALRACIAEQLAFEPTIGIGQPVTGFQSWKEGCMSSLLEWNFSQNRMDRKSEEQGDAKAVLTEDMSKVIHRYIINGELGAFEETIHKELAEAFRQSQARFVKLIVQFYFLLDALAHSAGVELAGREQLWIRPDRVLEFDTVEKAESFLVALGSKIHKTQADSEDAEFSVVQAAQQFIHQNYMVELNLNMLAERFNYNRSYFSELFKSKVGISFIQYVTEVRMEQAVRLLKETTLGLWDIAELTGFSNASYFSSKFKRMYGISPSEFRIANRGKD